MSMKDNDKWASQLIDELLEELAKVSSNADVVSEEIRSRYQDVVKAISYSEVKDLSAETSRTNEDPITDYPIMSDEESAILYHPQGASNVVDGISDPYFSETEELCLNVPSVSNRQTQNINKDCNKISNEVINCEEELPVFHKERKEEYITVSKRDTKRDSINADFHISELEVDANEGSIFSLPVTGLLNVEKESSVIYSDDSACSNQFKADIDAGNCILSENNEISKIEEVSFPLSAENLEFERIVLERIDAKIRRIGFGNPHDDNKEEKPKRSTSLVDEYHKYFTENYIKEEMEYRRIGEGRSCDAKSCYSNTENPDLEKPPENVKHTFVDDANNVEVENMEIDKRNDLINLEVAEIHPDIRPVNNNNKNILEAVYDNRKNNCTAHEKAKIKRHLTAPEKIAAIIPGIEKIPFCPLGPNAKTTNRSTNIIRPSSTRKNSILPKPKESSSLHRKSCIDANEDPVIAERAFKILTIYRNACTMFEDLFLRPTAIFIAEATEVVLFVFFLTASVLYMIYKSINLQRLNNFLKMNKISQSDSFKRKQQAKNGDFDGHTFLACNSSHEIEGNDELGENDSCISFPPEEYGNDTSVKKNISIIPENICVLNAVCEHAKQTLDDLYEKGSNFLEYLNREQRKAAVKSYNDALVSIILSKCPVQANEENTEDQMIVVDADFSTKDLDYEVIASSNALCNKCESKEAISDKFIESPKMIRKNYRDGTETVIPNMANKSDSNESLLADFPIISDKSNENIFNSTEIDHSDNEWKPRICSNYKTLSPSEINIFEDLYGTITSPGAFCAKCLRSSSLSVNVPSFSSMNFRSNSLSSLRTTTANVENSEFLFKKENFCSESVRNMGTEVPEMTDGNKEKPSDSLTKLNQTSELFHNDSRNTTCSMVPNELHGEEVSNKCNLESPESLCKDFQPTSAYSEALSHFLVSDRGEKHVCNTLCEKSFVYDNPGFLPSLPTANAASSNDVDSLMNPEESAVCDIRTSKRKNGGKLRRRMSGILGNWRSTTLMQCVMSNENRKKKYRKQINATEA